MIGALSGSIVEQNGDVVIVDVQGVGYEVTVTTAVLQGIQSLPHPIRLIVFTDVRDNAIVLFGFQDTLERAVFNLLKKVKGIGARTAMSIISAVGPQELLMSIGRNDIGALKRVPGVGNKTAERLIVELREHVSELAFSEQKIFSSGSFQIEQLPTSVAGSNAASNDVVLALEKLGFPTEQAWRVVQGTIQRHQAENPNILSDAGELLRLSLSNLGERQQERI